jgi:predicted P-loop ATPase/GTPase
MFLRQAVGRLEFRSNKLTPKLDIVNILKTIKKKHHSGANLWTFEYTQS